MTLLAKCCCNLTAMECCVVVPETYRTVSTDPCYPAEDCVTGTTCSLDALVLQGQAYAADSGGTMQYITCDCLQYTGADNRWSGTGNDGESWDVWLSNVEYSPISDCPVYNVLKLRIVYDGATMQWTAASEAGGACAGDDFEFATTDPDRCPDPDLENPSCCSAFNIDGFLALFPFVSGDEPDSFQVTIAGATGECCEAINGTHTLDFNSSDLSYEFACANRSNGNVVYEKDLSASGDCSLRRIVLQLATNAVGVGLGAILGGTINVGGCELFASVAISNEVVLGCSTSFHGSICPADPDNLTINLATLDADGSPNCPDGEPGPCDLTDVTISGVVTLA